MQHPPPDSPGRQGPRIESLAKARLVAQAALEKHAEDVIMMDLRSLSSVADFFIIGTAGSRPQLDALKEHIEAQLLQRGGAVWHVEGTASSKQMPGNPERDLQWLLMDCGDVVVHLFNTRAREFYQLERLWADAPRLPVTSSA